MLNRVVEPSIAAVCHVFVPRREVERTMHQVMVEATVPMHRVGGNELVRVGVLANRPDLILYVARPGVGDEVLPVEQQSWIFTLRVHRDLREVIVGLTPVGRCPMPIELRDGTVLLLQTAMKLRPGFRVEGGRPDFVIDLPAQYVGIVSVTNRQFLGDLASEREIAWAAEGELLASAVFIGATVLVDAQCVGILAGQPCRRCRRRCAEHDPNMVARRLRYSVVEPVEFELSFAGLQRAPRELGHSDDVDVRGLH